MRDDPELLDLMLADQDGQPAVYRPGEYWRGYQRRTAEALRRHGLSDFRNRPSVGKGYADVAPAEPDWTGVKAAISRLPKLRALFADCRRVAAAHASHASDLAARFYEAVVPEAPELDGIDTLHGGGLPVAWRGRTVAGMYLEQAWRQRAVPFDYSQARVAMEIGGGFGAWAHLLLAGQPSIRKLVYLDIPPMLYVGTQYLRHFFPGAVVDYRSTRGMDRIAFNPGEQREILCLCPWQIERLDASVDLFWNAASFGEMDAGIVRHYGEQVSARLAPGAQVGLFPNAPVESTPLHASLSDIKGAFPDVPFKEIEAGRRLFLYGHFRRP